MAFGFSKAVVLERLRQAIATAEEHWDELPGIDPEAGGYQPFPLSPAAHERGGVPLTHSTGQIETPNGEKAREAAAA